jgi:RNA polymerase sigma-70 factor (ECF subfamily)
MDASRRDHAIDQAYRDHAPEVYRVAYGVLRDRDEAMDATHDAFARAWERWDQYDSQRPLRAWLHGIVVHVALDQLRRRRVRRLAIPGLGGALLTETGRGFGLDPAGDAARRQVVDEALATLQPRARAALVLLHYYGYDYAQIGSFLGLTSGAVGSTLSRAHADLRRRLGVEEVPAGGPIARPASTTHTAPTDPTADSPEVHS